MGRLFSLGKKKNKKSEDEKHVYKKGKWLSERNN